MSILDSVKKMMHRRRELLAQQGQGDMARFLGRCERFRQLLAANHVALESMSDMGDALAGLRLIDMNYVRSQSVTTVAAVGRMVGALCAMHPGKYDALRPQLRQIARALDPILHLQEGGEPQGPVVLPMQDVAGRTDLAGSKTARLAELGEKLDVETPKGIVFSADAFRLFMGGGLREEIERLCMMSEGTGLDSLYSLSARISDAIVSAPIPQQIIDEALTLLTEFSPRVHFAVRSSAQDEDMQGMSFAGQYRSVLNVSPLEIFDAYRDVVASAYSVTAMSYRRNRGLRDDCAVMCVGCMEMVESVAGGVMYTADPLGIDHDCVHIHAVPGLPVSIVDGACDPDVWLVDRDSLVILKESIATKQWIHRCNDDGGTVRAHLSGEEATGASLNRKQVVHLAKLGRAVESYFGTPQDIEWALDAGGNVVILQSRPLEIQDFCRIDARAPQEDILFEGGSTASSGVGAGRVHYVFCDADLLALPDGAVMVVDQANPSWASALDRVSAVLAGHGSIAGHLANVAREFNVPAIFGMEKLVERLQALPEVLRDGITVDADACALYHGIHKDLLEKSSAKEPLFFMENSPVMECLRQAMEYIIPLNLKDAKAPDFCPESCRTLHDITRFCHEKAVREMFGRSSSSIPARAARRLVTDVPTQYWVLDLGGGLAPCTGDVGPDDVRSLPMRALWQGMNCKAWEGPPPADARGFFSVVMEAAANPALEAGAMNSMGERNYFLVGDGYCNLQSRFGFHFSTVEGHAGPFAEENYAYLQFKGGGADPERRKLRAATIRNILARKGFMANARDDAVFASLENVSAHRVLRAMIVLGHLIVHTRQLDMAMGDIQAAKEYEVELMDDISEVLLRSEPMIVSLLGPSARMASTGMEQ